MLVEGADFKKCVRVLQIDIVSSPRSFDEIGSIAGAKVLVDAARKLIEILYRL